MTLDRRRAPKEAKDFVKFCVDRGGDQAATWTAVETMALFFFGAAGDVGLAYFIMTLPRLQTAVADGHVAITFDKGAPMFRKEDIMRLFPARTHDAPGRLQ